MAGQSSSSSTPQFAFSNLVGIPHRIPHPICGDVGQSSSSPTPQSAFSDLVGIPHRIPHPICGDVGQSSSSPTPQSAFSNLVGILHQIPNPICGDVGGDLEHDCGKASKLLDELKKDVEHIQNSLEKLRRFAQDLDKYKSPLAGVLTNGELQLSDEARASFHKLARAAQRLKNQLPPSSYYQFPKSFADDPLPNVSSSSTSVGNEYNKFTLRERKCLWCFMVFPENAQIKKRVLINWWIGEGLLPAVSTDSSGGVPKPTMEREGEELLQLLEDKQFIKRVVKKNRGSDSWSMDPSVRSFLSSKAKEEMCSDLDRKILDGKVMLLKSINQVGSLDGMVNPVTTVFNVNKSKIDEREAKTLCSMETLVVLYLGRSQVTDATQNNIQINNLKLIMNVLGKMKKLRLLSFQGILSLDKLPDSVCGLTDLMVLDLRVCQALEALPRRIGKLKNLRHLDMSGCHLLLRMPKGIKWLSNLEVLKGFVVGNEEPGSKWVNSSLRDLKMLMKLHKLSIFVSREIFPKHEDLVDLANIKGLQNLKMIWNPSSSKDKESQGHADHPFKKFLVKEKISIEKLDLWCPPKYTAKALLGMARAFPGVKRLYIRGADFDRLEHHTASAVSTQNEDDNGRVEHHTAPAVSTQNEDDNGRVEHHTVPAVSSQNEEDDGIVEHHTAPAVSTQNEEDNGRVQHHNVPAVSTQNEDDNGRVQHHTAPAVSTQNEDDNGRVEHHTLPAVSTQNEEDDGIVEHHTVPAVSTQNEEDNGRVEHHTGPAVSTQNEEENKRVEHHTTPAVSTQNEDDNGRVEQHTAPDVSTQNEDDNARVQHHTAPDVSTQNEDDNGIVEHHTTPDVSTQNEDDNGRVQHHTVNKGDEWETETLRLLCLPKMEMTMEELKLIFPKISYLEVQDCPKLQLSQYLDEEGVWESKKSSPDPME